MGQAGPTKSRVEAALELVQKQRKVVEASKVGSPAHRQASEVLALIEESHFLLSELDRTLVLFLRPTQVGPAQVGPDRKIESREAPPKQRLRFSAPLALLFVAAIVASAVVLEIADPASMNVQAGEQGGMFAQP